MQLFGNPEITGI